MPRILPAALSNLFSHDDVCVSSDSRLIINDYSDAEYDLFNGGQKRSICVKPKKRAFQSAPPIQWSGTDEAVSDIQQPGTIGTVSGHVQSESRNSGTFLNDFYTIAENNIRSKPTYADCWLIGKTNDLEKIAEYDTPSGKVLIGLAADGETEYNLTPNEYSYPDSLNAVIGFVIDDVRNRYRSDGGRMDKQSVLSIARSIIMNHSDTIEAVHGNDSRKLDTIIGEMCDIVYRYTVGLGVFDILLADPKLEDIYIDAPCEKNRIHVTMNGITGINSHLRCRTNLIVDRKEVMNLINVLKRESGLSFCESNPVLETDMRQHDARATVVGYPMSPNGDAVAIRKHSLSPWTLTRLVANGTIDAKVAGLLSFMVENRVTFLVCGARGSGKSSLLSALMFEFPLSQRILTIEDTIELPSESMRKMGYKVQSMLIDDRMSGNELSRADEALRVSLRMGESAIILGEVRGEEAKTLYQSMRTGRAGSSIMGTIHGDSAKSVYERVVHDIGISPDAFMATDILLTLGTVRDRRTGSQIRKMNELVATGDYPGEFIDVSNNEALFGSPMMRRVMANTQQSRLDVIKEIRARSLIRAFLADMGKNHGDEYFGPDWVGIANDHVSKNHGRTAEDVLKSFKIKFSSMTGLSD